MVESLLLYYPVSFHIRLDRIATNSLVRINRSVAVCFPLYSVKRNSTQSEEFVVKVGVHQGSVLSPLLFIMVLEALSREFIVGLPLEMLYADDLVLLAESMEEVTERYKRWQFGMGECGKN